MSKKPLNLQNLKPWKKGESGNPNGRPPLSEDQKKVRKLTNDELQDIGDLLLFSDLSNLKSIIANENETVLRRWLARIIMDGVKTKNLGSLEKLLDRLIGKTPDNINVSGNIHARLVDIMEKLDDDDE